MSYDLQQLALLDALLGNWDSVQIRMGERSQVLQASLGGIAVRLASSKDRESIAVILDDLLDLLQGTPAYAFVQELIVRAQMAQGKTRELGSDTEFSPPDVSDRLDGIVGSVSRQLGQAVSADTEPCEIQVYFATNRKPGGTEEARFATDAAEKLTYGLAKVTIPVGRHLLGHVEERSWWNVLGDRNDKRRYVVLGEVRDLTDNDFIGRLEGEPEAANGLLVFLHGYNVTFEDAARRAAQLAFDVRFKGRIVLFSWPSLGCLLGYGADEERALLSAQEFRRFLKSIEDGPWGKVHLLAHSMGNRVLLHGLAGDAWPNRKLGQVLFVAADVYVDMFSQQFPRIKDSGANYTSYASEKDRALLFSSLLHKAERIGVIHGAPFVTDGLETIDATAVDTSLLGLGLGHSYFSDKRSLLTDIGILVGEGLPASSRGLFRAQDPGYWYFPR